MCTEFRLNDVFKNCHFFSFWPIFYQTSYYRYSWQRSETDHGFLFLFEARRIKKNYF